MDWALLVEVAGGLDVGPQPDSSTTAVIKRSGDRSRDLLHASEGVLGHEVAPANNAERSSEGTCR